MIKFLAPLPLTNDECRCGKECKGISQPKYFKLKNKCGLMNRMYLKFEIFYLNKEESSHGFEIGKTYRFKYESEALTRALIPDAQVRLRLNSSVELKAITNCELEMAVCYFSIIPIFLWCTSKDKILNLSLISNETIISSVTRLSSNMFKRNIALEGNIYYIF